MNKKQIALIAASIGGLLTFIAITWIFNSIEGYEILRRILIVMFVPSIALIVYGEYTT